MPHERFLRLRNHILLGWLVVFPLGCGSSPTAPPKPTANQPQEADPPPVDFQEIDRFAHMAAAAYKSAEQIAAEFESLTVMVHDTPSTARGPNHPRSVRSGRISATNA